MQPREVPGRGEPLLRSFTSIGGGLVKMLGIGIGTAHHRVILAVLVPQISQFIGGHCIHFPPPQAPRGEELPKLGNAFWFEVKRCDAPSEEPEVEGQRHDLGHEAIRRRELLRHRISPGCEPGPFFNVLANGKNAASIRRKPRLEGFTPEGWNGKNF